MKHLSFLIKPASGLCNMRCQYCFYSDLSALRKEQQYGLMTEETLTILVKKAFSSETSSVSFAFQGGEPTLIGLEFYQTLIQLVERYNQSGTAVSYAIQTNGMVIDEEWAEFFATHDFLVGLSLDGTKELHDQHRKGLRQKGTYQQVMRTARLFKRKNVAFNILTVVTEPLAQSASQVYHFFKHQGFQHLQFIPCFDGLGEVSPSHSYSLTTESYGEFLCELFDLWYEDFIKGQYVSIRHIDNYIQMLAGFPPESCAMAGVCTAYLLVEADGSVFPCDFYATDQYYLGNLLDSDYSALLTGERAKKFVNSSRNLPLPCQSCRYVRLCRSGCRRDCEPVGEQGKSLNRYCKAYQHFFAHALPRMTYLSKTIF